MNQRQRETTWGWPNMDASSAQVPFPNPEALMRHWKMASPLPVTNIRRFTVEESKGHRGDMVGTHVKNLYLRDRKKRIFWSLRRRIARST